MKKQDWLWLAVAVVAFGVGFSSNHFCLFGHKNEEQNNVVGFRDKTIYPLELDFSLANLNGQPVDSGQWQNEVVLINFWATWCAPCLKEMPVLDSFHDQYREHGLRVVGVSLDNEILTRQFVEKLGIDYSILLGEQQGTRIGEVLNVPLFGLPATIAISADRQQHQVFLGELNKKKIKKLLENVKFDI
ncbi:MAG: TlpA family protein disulfide reductase [Gammaproteobacteria bacterium]|nr:TlpA family protein disulfide reductase [Gammaproteobacteria bacterium]